MRDERLWTRLGLLSTGLGLVLTGCGPAVPADGGGGSPAPTSRVSTPPSQVVRRPPPPPTFTPVNRRPPVLQPPSLNRPGGAPTNGPTSRLPPPQNSGDLASRLESEYGFRILGPGASPANLATLERGLEDFKPSQLRGLKEVNFPLVHGLQPLQGLWESDGRQAKIKLWAQTGRSKQVHLHTITHEFGHHHSLFARRSWGTALDHALGQSANSFPSQYSRTQSAEKVAENIAFSLLGPESENRALPGWNPGARARDLLRQEFGARLKL